MGEKSIAQQALLDIADEIERRGHFQGVRNEYTPGSCCLMANTVEHKAMGLALIDGHLFGEGYVRSSYYGLVEWNDTTPTTEVLATLRRVGGQV